MIIYLNKLYFINVFIQKFINGPLLQFVKSIQVFLTIFKSTNIYMLCVCLSQLRKCILMHETTMLEQNTVPNFAKVCILIIYFNMFAYNV